MKIADEIVNSKTGQRLEFIKESGHTMGQMLHIKSSYMAFSVEPPVHYHPAQDEYFTILKGRMRVRLEGEVSDLELGDKLTISAGQRHSMWNPWNEVAVVDWRVSPALETEGFLRRMTMEANGPKAASDGRPGVFRALYILARYYGCFRVPGPIGVAVKIVRFVLFPVLGRG